MFDVLTQNSTDITQIAISLEGINLSLHYLVGLVALRVAMYIGNSIYKWTKL